MEREPDWTIQFDEQPEQLTDRQVALLDELERVLSSFGRRPEDPDAVMRGIRPVVVALHETGLSTERIADNSRVRPEGVKRLLGG